MPRSTILIGGVQGVGKTTVINEVKRQKPSWAIYDPSEMFEIYYLDNPVLEPETIELMVAASFKGLAKDVTLVNWHYGVWKGQDYIPHISWQLMEKVAREKEPEAYFVLVLLEASVAEIVQRRKRDIEAGIKQRKLTAETIGYELTTERTNFERQLSIFQSICSAQVSSIIYDNQDSPQTAQKIIRLIDNLD